MKLIKHIEKVAVFRFKTKVKNILQYAAHPSQESNPCPSLTFSSHHSSNFDLFPLPYLMWSYFQRK